MEKTNSKKVISNKAAGITLIALIITIIVLLILAGITINLTIGEDGILKRAEEAGKNYTEAAENEKTQLDEFLNETDKIIANVTGGKTNSGGGTSSGGSNQEPSVLVTDVTLNKASTEIKVGNTETLTATIVPDNASNKIVNWTTNNENVAKVENGVVTAVAKGTAIITVTATDGSGKSASCEVNVIDRIDASVLALEPGDYIKYDSGTNGDILCRVLYPASSEYGLQIISDKNVKNVTLGSDMYSDAVLSYNNAIQTLNGQAENYINYDYAQDARCVGSVPIVDANGNFIQKGNESEFEEMTMSGYINTKGSDENYRTDEDQMKTANILTTGETYLLASRMIASMFEGGVPNYYFYIRQYSSGGVLEGTSMMSINVRGSYGGSGAFERGTRFCFSLKSEDIKIVGGTGEDAGNAYIIGK